MTNGPFIEATVFKRQDADSVVYCCLVTKVGQHKTQFHMQGDSLLALQKIFSSEYLKYKDQYSDGNLGVGMSLMAERIIVHLDNQYVLNVPLSDQEADDFVRLLNL